MNPGYICTELAPTINGYIACKSWQPITDAGFKLTYGQIGAFILAIAFVHASVFAIKVVKRSFF